MCAFFFYPIAPSAHPLFFWLQHSHFPWQPCPFSRSCLRCRWNLLSSLGKALRWDFSLLLISLIGSHCWRVKAGLPGSWPAAGSHLKVHVHGAPGTVLLKHRIHPQRASRHPRAWPTPALLWVCVCARAVTSLVSDSAWPHGFWPARLLCPWHFPGKDTGVGCHALLQGIFPTQGSNLCSCVFCNAGGPGKPQLPCTGGQLSLILSILAEM